MREFERWRSTCSSARRRSPSTRRSRASCLSLRVLEQRRRNSSAGAIFPALQRGLRSGTAFGAFYVYAKVPATAGFALDLLERAGVARRRASISARHEALRALRLTARDGGPEEAAVRLKILREGQADAGRRAASAAAPKRARS
jgi:hypothetical protein